MEEVWLERFGGDESSVHLEDFVETPSAWRDDALAAKWASIRQARRVVTAAWKSSALRKSSAHRWKRHPPSISQMQSC